MNNDITIRPAYLQEGPKDAFADHAGFMQPARISMDNDRFNVIDENGDEVLNPSFDLQVIMLWENDTRLYWGGDGYKKEATAPPMCFSDNKITPSVSALEPQSEFCANCPRAVRDQPGYKGKGLVPACKEHYKVACLVAGAKGKVFLLSVGPGSRKPYTQYLNWLEQHHAAADQVITKLDYANNTFGFSFQGWINERTANMVKAISETDEPAMIVNAFDKPRQATLPAPKNPDEIAYEMLKTGTQVHYVPPEYQTGGRIETAPTQSTSAMEAPKRRGRPPKSESAGSPPPAASAGPPIQQTFAPAPKKDNSGGFGLEQPEKPPENIQDALNRAFGP